MRILYYSIISIVTFLDGAQEENLDLTVQTKDGTMFSTTIELKEIELKTDQGKISIPIKEIKYIKAKNDTFEVKTKKTITGRLVQEEFTFKTNHGTLKIKSKEIDQILPGKKKALVNDEDVAGYWDFNGDEDIKLNGSQYATEDGVSAVKCDLSKGNWLEIPHKEELSIKESLTIEVKFKYQGEKAKAHYTPLAIKYDTTGYYNYHLSLQNKGKGAEKTIGTHVYCDNGQLGNAHASKAALKEQTWYYIAATINSKDGKIEIYLDGVKQETSFSGMLSANLKTNDAPITMFSLREGKSTGAKDIFWVDFLRISTKARSEEEIKTIYESEGGFLSGKQPTDKQFNGLVTTRSGERYVCKLEKDSLGIECQFGDVKIKTSDIGKINLFNYRKDQVDKLHMKAKELIPKLGDDDPQVRENTQTELKNLGWIIIPVLEAAKDHTDDEIKTRVKKLLELYSERKYEITKDSLQGNGLSLRGWLKHDSIKATARYGQIEIKIEDVKFISFNNLGPAIEGSVMIVLNDNSILAGKMNITNIEIKTDYGTLKVPVQEILNATPGKDEDKIVTKTSTIFGKITHEEFEIDSQAGKLRIKKADIKKISTGLDKKESKKIEEKPEDIPVQKRE